MKTKLLYFFIVLLSAFAGLQAQTISIVGEAAGGWPDDNPATPDTHIMSTTDNITYTYNDLVLTTAAPGGGVKFRQDGAWIINWGSAAFPMGTGTQNGNNILTVAGTYDVTFNRITGAYAFQPVGSFSNIGIIGSSVSEAGFAGPDIDMITFDGVTYTLVNHQFLGGFAKFRMNDSWDVNWGGTTFPSGTASLSGSDIPVPAGTFTVTFNLQTGEYDFQPPKIGILGTAVSASGFDGPDTDMTTTDGITYVLASHTFTDGLAKFRQDDSWATNWGGTEFPAGVGITDGSDIPVTAGTYSVTFNRITGAYAFAAPIVFASIGILGDAVNANGFDGPDVDMTTEDGVNYVLENHVFSNGYAKFRVNDSWDLNYGGSTFPSGDAAVDGANISVVAGTYSVYLNTNSMTYVFVGNPAHPTVGIIGTAVSAAGFSGLDTNLVTTDGETYTITHTFLAGEAKFRQDDSWDISWGSDNFPSGGNDGNNIVIPAGTYDVTFNRTTGVYNFTATGEYPAVGILGTAVTAGGFDDPDTNMSTENGIIYTLNDWTFINGEAKFRENDSWDVSWGAAAFPTGTATVGGPNIPVTAGTYDVTFNRITGVYSFTGDSFPQVGMIGDAVLGSGFEGDDVDMFTSDGINYNLNAYDFVTGSAKFRQDNGWSVNWGSNSFPSGTGIQDGDNIPVAGNRYNVWFDRSTGAYAFNYVSIGVLGTALSGYDAPDFDMSTVDGINYSVYLTLTSGTIKLRENDSWAVNWGGDLSVSNVLTLNGPDIEVDPAPSGALIEFNRLTGVLLINYSIGIGEHKLAKTSVYPNPSGTVWNFENPLVNISRVDIMDVSGKLLISKTSAASQLTVDAVALPAGMYFARITSGENVETVKLLRK